MEVASNAGSDGATLESVLTTLELRGRPSPPAAYKAETDDFLALAQQLADHPEAAMERLAEIALDATGAGSAGVSLVSEDHVSWAALAGAWRRHSESQPPPAPSPCTFALESSASQMFHHPEAFFTGLRSLSPVLIELIVAPFYVSGKAVGTIWAGMHDPSAQFYPEDLRRLENLGRFAAAAYPVIARLRDQQQRSQMLRDANKNLLVSALRQHDLLDQAQASEQSLLEIERQLENELAEARHLQESSMQLMLEKEGHRLFEHILDTALAILRSQSGCLHRLQPYPVGQAQLVAHHGCPPTAIASWALVGSKSKGVHADVLATGRPLLVALTNAKNLAPEELALYTEMGVKAVLAYPLISGGGKIVGLLSAHWLELHELSDRDLRLLEILAPLAADLMERSETEHALRDRNEDLKYFSLAVSHDLQEPLRAVNVFTSLLEEQYSGKIDPQADRFIAFAADGARKIEALLRDMRSYWLVNERRIEKLEHIKVGDLLERTLHQLETPIRDLSAKITYAWMPEIVAESMPLTLLLENLMTNALKYHRPGVAPQVHIDAVRRGSEWTFSVADNGVGIGAAHLEEIFTPFKRLHGQEISGTGIGLALCERVLERYGGRIWAESTVGVGTTFYFTLPAEFQPDAGPPASSSENPALG